jgi:hypothetical protein
VWGRLLLCIACPSYSDETEQFRRALQNPPLDALKLGGLFGKIPESEKEVAEGLRQQFFRDTGFNTPKPTPTAQAVFEVLKKECDAKVAAEKAEEDAKIMEKKVSQIMLIKKLAHKFHKKFWKKRHLLNLLKLMFGMNIKTNWFILMNFRTM